MHFILNSEMGLLSSRQLKNNIELSMIPSLGRQVTLRFILDIFYGKIWGGWYET